MAKPISASLACASAAAVFSWRAVLTVDEVNEFTSTAAMPTTRLTSMIINAEPRCLQRPCLKEAMRLVGMDYGLGVSCCFSVSGFGVSGLVVFGLADGFSNTR